MKSTNATPLIPVRKMYDDGYIAVRYLHSDGSEPEELPEEYTLGATLHLASEIWDVDRYRVIARSHLSAHTPQALTNLLHLSNTNPLLFDEALTFLETAQDDELRFYRHVISRKAMVPTERAPDANYHEMHKALMQHGKLLMELGKEYAVDMEAHYAQMMFGDARKIIGGFDHPHFAAAAMTAWIIHRGTNKRAKITYDEHADDIAYINSRLDEVVEARYDLARFGDFSKKRVEETLGQPKPLRIGSL